MGGQSKALCCLVLPSLFRFSSASQGLPEGEHSHPSQPAHSKTPQLSQEPKGAQAAGLEPTHHSAVSRHVPQMEAHVHLPRAQADVGPTSYPSPVAISVKQELPSPHQAQAVQKPALFIPTTTGPGVPPGLPLSRPEPQSALKPDPVSQRPVDMVQLLTVSSALVSAPFLALSAVGRKAKDRPGRVLWSPVGGSQESWGG